MEALVNNNDIVLLSTGATKPRDLPIKNREGAGVYFAMEFLGQNTKSLLDHELKENDYIDAKGKDVIVIGGGDTGNDCLGTSLRHGCKTLTNFEILLNYLRKEWTIILGHFFLGFTKVDYGHEESEKFLVKIQENTLYRVKNSLEIKMVN